SSLYIPKVEEVKKIHVVNNPQDIARIAQKDTTEDEEQVPKQQNGILDSNDSSSHTNEQNVHEDRTE
ncbi:hypothetical protein SK128_003431, partial [Halocaridina rubra]